MTDAGRMAIGAVDDLVAGGPALVFDLDAENFITGFALRHGDDIYCYLNRCPHLGSELDWNRGEFFSEDGRHIVCSTHGALFDPQDGQCLAGPCRGQALTRLAHEIDEGVIYVLL